MPGSKQQLIVLGSLLVISIAILCSAFVYLTDNSFTRQQSYDYQRELCDRAKVGDAAALQELINIMQTSRISFQRTNAAAFIGRLGGKGAPAVGALIRELRSNDRFLQHQAVISLGFIGPPARQALPELLVAVKNRTGVDPATAVDAIGRIANADDSDAISTIETFATTANKDQASITEFALKSIRSRSASSTTLSNQEDGTQ